MMGKQTNEMYVLRDVVIILYIKIVGYFKLLLITPSLYWLSCFPLSSEYFRTFEFLVGYRHHKQIPTGKLLKIKEFVTVASLLFDRSQKNIPIN